MNAVELRPARWADQAAVEALAAQIWDGEDYLADCFADWIRETEGQFTLAIIDKELAACNKLTRVGPSEWWLEGLRVDPRFRGMGLARLLHDYAVALARKQGGGRIRLATACDNPAVPRIALKTGFMRQNGYLHTKFSLPTLDGLRPERFASVTAAELPQFTHQLTASPAFAAQGGLMEDFWVWLEIVPRLAQLQADGRLFWHQREERRAVLIANREEDGDLLNVNFCGVEDEGELAAVIADFPHLTAHFERPDLRYKPVDTPENRAALAQNGWWIDPETVLCVFEMTNDE
jgi:GNAT superfamily N-acetyltransferase